MSRNPPFPTRRRSPSNAYPISPPSTAPEYTNTRPLYIHRPSTPTNAPSRYLSSSPSQYGMQPMPPNSAPLGPLRPQRSELRSRASDLPSERGSYAPSENVNRDSHSVGEAQTNPYLSHDSQDANPTPSRNRTPRQPPTSPYSPNGETTTPKSLNSALSAFRSAAERKKTIDSEDPEYWKERERHIEEEKARQQRIRERVPGLTPSRSRKPGEIDAVLDQVKDSWQFVIDPEFSNVELALKLLDQSSLGKDMDSFRNTKHMLSKALKGSVDEHYQAFNGSLAHHASLLNHLNDTQQQMSHARSALVATKDALGSKRTDLVQLWNRGQMLEEMLRILDQIEYLKTVPDLLETLMSEKRLLQAAVLLVKSLKIIKTSDMQEIGAVLDLRSYLVGQETALRDILVDELQSHIYLKSFWCDSRWAAYTPNQQDLPKCEGDDDAAEVPTTDSSSPTSPGFRPSRLKRFLNDLSLKPNEPPMELGSSSINDKDNVQGGPFSTLMPRHSPLSTQDANPESDSFAYMETLLESLAVLGKLGTALDSIAQRLQSEVFNLVDTTLDEVEEREDYGRRRSLSSLSGGMGKSESVFVLANGSKPSDIKGKIPTSQLRLAALESSAKRADHETLKDLFWTLYSKLEAVAQGLRVVSEVANRIGSRRDYRDSSGTKPGFLFPLNEVWQPVQAEVKRLISDYLTDEQQGSAASRNPITSINEILREGKFQRDKVKPVFRFSDTDAKVMVRALKAHEDALTKVLKDTMPGLAPAGPSGDNTQTIVSSNDEHLLGSDQHHRLLIRPDAFHVTILFQPTLRFLEAVTETLPAGVESIRGSTAVLDDFVLKVYLPQLEEQVLDFLHDAVSGQDAFQPNPQSQQLSPEPLIKSAMQLMALINSLCAMLQTSPFHRENYSRLMLGVVIQFYQRCSDRFQALTTTSNGTDVVMGAQWAQRSELQPPLSELRSVDELFSASQLRLCQQETNIELEFLRKNTIGKGDLITSNRTFTALATLYHSVSWFATELTALKSRPEDTVVSPTTPGTLEPMTAMTAVTPFLPPPPTDEGGLRLTLSREMALRFQALLRTYDQLSSLILDTLRIDIRCRVFYYLDASMRHGNYSAAYEAAEPDAHIVDLNNELVQCDELISVNLPRKARQFVFAGLGSLMEHLMIRNAGYLRLPNAFGIKKVMRNISALQQCIKTLSCSQEDANFDSAKRYYSLFWLSPKDMLAGIKKRQEFTFGEYQTMLNLQCGVLPNDGGMNGAKAPRAADRNYSNYFIELHAMELGTTSP